MCWYSEGRTYCFACVDETLGIFIPLFTINIYIKCIIVCIQSVSATFSRICKASWCKYMTYRQDENTLLSHFLLVAKSYVAASSGVQSSRVCDVLGCVMSSGVWCPRVCGVLGCLVFSGVRCPPVYGVLGCVMSSGAWCPRVCSVPGLCDVLRNAVSSGVWCPRVCDVLRNAVPSGVLCPQVCGVLGCAVSPSVLF